MKRGLNKSHAEKDEKEKESRDMVAEDRGETQVGIETKSRKIRGRCRTRETRKFYLLRFARAYVFWRLQKSLQKNHRRLERKKSIKAVKPLADPLGRRKRRVLSSGRPRPHSPNRCARRGCPSDLRGGVAACGAPARQREPGLHRVQGPRGGLREGLRCLAYADKALLPLPDPPPFAPPRRTWLVSTACQTGEPPPGSPGLEEPCFPFAPESRGKFADFVLRLAASRRPES